MSDRSLTFKKLIEILSGYHVREDVNKRNGHMRKLVSTKLPFTYMVYAPKDSFTIVSGIVRAIRKKFRIGVNNGVSHEKFYEGAH